MLEGRTTWPCACLLGAERAGPAASAMAAAGGGGEGASAGEREQAAAFESPIYVTGSPCAFSPHERRLLALSGPDGRLRVWETASSRLHHEYVPSAHLSAACTCLAWAPPGVGGGRPPPSKVFKGWTWPAAAPPRTDILGCVLRGLGLRARPCGSAHAQQRGGACH